MNKMKRARLLLLAILTMAGSTFLVACGGGDDDTFTVANWPLYIDENTIDEFQDESGISTNYNEEVNDNNEFFGKVQPQFAQGDAGGRSIIVVTDWMAEKMQKLGYIEDLDKSKIPVVEKNMIPSLRSPSFDPERKFSVPWQSGMTGLVVRTDLAPDVKSINDLFDPKYKGKVTLLTELRDTVPLVMAADGIDPTTASKQDWLDTIDKIKKNVDNGQIRRFTGNDYVQDMAKGDVVAAIGWSGDAVQAEADNENIKYVQPAQGCSLWSDNMLIPVGAPHVDEAYEFMNYVYEPENQAQITEYVNFLSPVKGVKQVLLKQDPEIANNDLIFPSAEFTKNCFAQVSPPGDDEEQQEVEQAFQDVVTG